LTFWFTEENYIMYVCMSHWFGPCAQFVSSVSCIFHFITDFSFLSEWVWKNWFYPNSYFMCKIPYQVNFWMNDKFHNLNGPIHWDICYIYNLMALFSHIVSWCYEVFKFRRSDKKGCVQVILSWYRQCIRIPADSKISHLCWHSKF